MTALCREDGHPVKFKHRLGSSVWRVTIQCFFSVRDRLLSSHHPSSSQLSICHIVNMQASNSKCTNFHCVITPNSRTTEREMQEGGKQCLETRDACIEYRSDKCGTLSAPPGKMGSNLLICSCQLCFCVPSDPGQLTGRGCKDSAQKHFSTPM